jgi:hypothetical protein
MDEFEMRDCRKNEQKINQVCLQFRYTFSYVCRDTYSMLLNSDFYISAIGKAPCLPHRVSKGKNASGHVIEIWLGRIFMWLCRPHPP